MLDYGALYDRLLTGFAADEIVFVTYEAAVRDPRGVVGHLLDRVGLPEAAEGFAPLAGDFERLGRAPRRLGGEPVDAPAPARLVAQARGAFADAFGETARSTIYSRPEVAAVVAHFAPLNAAFEARYRRLDPDFALAPLALADDLVHRGQLTRTAFWIALARRLHAGRS